MELTVKILSINIFRFSIEVMATSKSFSVTYGDAVEVGIDTVVTRIQND